VDRDSYHWVVVAGAGAVRAQETTPGPGRLEVTLVPGGGTFFTSSASEPAFGSYNLGAALTYNVNRIVGFEETSAARWEFPDLQFGVHREPEGPQSGDLLRNVVISAPTRLRSCRRGGIGGLTNLQQVNSASPAARRS
jgi:hypothetical protein